MVSMSSIWLARVNIMFTQVELTNQSHSTSLNTPLSFEIMTKKERPTSIYHITVHHIVVRYFKNHRIAIIVGKENRSKPANSWSIYYIQIILSQKEINIQEVHHNQLSHNWLFGPLAGNTSISTYKKGLLILSKFKKFFKIFTSNI